MGRVKLDNVTKVYPGDEEVLAVDDVSFTVQDGEFLVIVGPSGCGKSTTLRMIAGLEEITAGTIEINENVVNGMKPQDRNIAMVFQNYALYPHMTVRKNMSFGLRLSEDYTEEEIESRVNEAADLLEIPELLDQHPRELSGGQQQRVALGRAIVRDPAVFLLDEPLSNLDAKLRTQMRTELQRLQNELEVTTIYVTHDQTEAMTMGDRIAVLNDGKLQQIDTPEGCYEEPNNEFVAGFIGSPSMNFFEVDATDADGDGVSISSSEFEHRLPDVEIEGGSYTLGIRPEDLRLVDGDGVIEATIDVVEPVGADNYLYLRTHEGDVEFIARVDGDIQPEEGSDVEVTFDSQHLHFFRPGGRRIPHLE